MDDFNNDDTVHNIEKQVYWVKVAGGVLFLAFIATVIILLLQQRKSGIDAFEAKIVAGPPNQPTLLAVYGTGDTPKAGTYPLPDTWIDVTHVIAKKLEHPSDLRPVFFEPGPVKIREGNETERLVVMVGDNQVLQANKGDTVRAKEFLLIREKMKLGNSPMMRTESASGPRTEGFYAVYGPVSEDPPQERPPMSDTWRDVSLLLYQKMQEDLGMIQVNNELVNGDDPAVGVPKRLVIMFHGQEVEQVAEGDTIDLRQTKARLQARIDKEVAATGSIFREESEAYGVGPGRDGTPNNVTMMHVPAGVEIGRAGDFDEQALATQFHEVRTAIRDLQNRMDELQQQQQVSVGKTNTIDMEDIARDLAELNHMFARLKQNGPH